MKERYSVEAVEEASAWLALLHGPRRTRTLEEGFRRWIDASPQHERAFDAVTAMWDASAGLSAGPIPPPVRVGGTGDVHYQALTTTPMGSRRPAHTAFIGLGIVAMSIAFAATALLFYLHSRSIATGIGEQRMLTLDDGTRVYLNTNTRMHIAYSKERRGVVLDSGEALFEVARRGPQWPFVVTAGFRQVTALGTSFAVREDPDAVAITLIEGNVSVSSSGAATDESRILNPGQRLTFAKQRPPELDRPAVEEVTAWRQGRVELNDTPLSTAAAEMNRYSTTQLRVESDAASAIPIKGAFRAGDVESFAQSIASTCHLGIVSTPHEILLTGLPSANCQDSSGRESK